MLYKKGQLMIRFRESGSASIGTGSIVELLQDVESENDNVTIRRIKTLPLKGYLLITIAAQVHNVDICDFKPYYKKPIRRKTK